MLRRCFILLLAASAAWPACAAERVCLKSGFCLRADSYTPEGTSLHLKMGAGAVEFASAEVASITFDPDPVAPPSTAVTPPASVPVLDSGKLLSEAAAAEGLDPDFVRSVAHVESNLKQNAVSSKGALGLMQLMPQTAHELAVDPAQASQNALGGAKYLRALLIRYHYNSALALAAYNAGPGAVARYNGVPPYAETRNYVLKVTREYDRLRASHQAQDAR